MKTAESQSKRYSRMEALYFLYRNSEYGNEWQGAGMWEAVEKIFKSGKLSFTEKYLRYLLAEAKNR